MAYDTDRFQLHTLDNGLNVLMEHMPEMPSVSAGFLVHTGARDEKPEIAGVSHFLEHMMFKGTSRRNAFQINLDFDRMGAEYNAQTGNEHTFYYGWVRSADLRNLLELLADMMRSLLPAEEFETEKQVILEEIAMYEDDLEMTTVDNLLEKAFAGHPLGVSVIGTNDTVGGLTREQMLEYYQARYTPENMLLIVCGNFDRDELLGEVEKHCGAWARGEASRQQPQPRINPGRHVITKDRFQRQTVCLGYDSPSGRDAEGKDVADVAATVLGRPGNSRFFWEIVQKGLAPMAQAFQFDFTDTGLFILYAACDPEKAPTVLGRMREEAERLQEEGPEADEIERVVNQVKTQFALSAETPFTRLVQLAEDMETLGRPRSPDERLAELSRITPDRVKQHLEQWPIRGDGILVSVGPRSELE